jgi:Flp pilus assembly protein TadG
MSNRPARKYRQRGQVLLLTTLILVPLFGMLGLVTDIGYMHYIKMSAQTAAQAAAEAAIIDFHATTGGASFSCGGNVVCASSPAACTVSITTPVNSVEHGCMYAQANGFNTAGSVTYETGRSTTPPTASGAGTASYWVTFRVTQRVPQLFSAVLGNTSGLVTARSTAALMGATDCIYALDPAASGAVSVGGTATLTSACGLLVNSNNSCAISTNGTATLSAPEYDVVGNTCTHNPLSPSPNTGITPASDPLASLPVPASAPYTCDYVNYNASNWSNPTLNPGVYCGGIQVRNNNYTLNAGTYILVGGGLTTQNANSNISGSGVMIYNTFDSTHSYSPIDIAATSTVNLSAPNTGTYAGMLFFEDRNAPASSDTYGGGATAVYQGTIYAKKAAITMHGNSSVSAAYTIIVANTISLVGTTGLNDNYSLLPGGASPIQKIAVVE